MLRCLYCPLDTARVYKPLERRAQSLHGFLRLVQRGPGAAKSEEKLRAFLFRSRIRKSRKCPGVDLFRGLVPAQRQCFLSCNQDVTDVFVHAPDARRASEMTGELQRMLGRPALVERLQSVRCSGMELRSFRRGQPGQQVLAHKVVHESPTPAVSLLFDQEPHGRCLAEVGDNESLSCVEAGPQGIEGERLAQDCGHHKRVPGAPRQPVNPQPDQVLRFRRQGKGSVSCRLPPEHPREL